ncbi:hypothetical protein ThidrDRAFT_4715, partial [Thiorhodococcus drewsii AZ1]
RVDLTRLKHDDTKLGIQSKRLKAAWTTSSKKPKLIPGTADPEAQKTFLAEHEKLKKTKGDADPIYFMDTVHPQHSPLIAQGWIKRGEVCKIRSNVRFDDSMNAVSRPSLCCSNSSSGTKTRR